MGWNATGGTFLDWNKFAMTGSGTADRDLKVAEDSS